MDHAHYAMMLALLDINQNYGEFSKSKYAANVQSFSNTFFIPDGQEVLSRQEKEEPTTKTKNGIRISRAGIRSRSSSSIKRSMF
jgi:hypothetical protein